MSKADKDVPKSVKARLLRLQEFIHADELRAYRAKQDVEDARKAYKAAIRYYLGTDNFELSNTCCLGSREPPFSYGLCCVWVGWHDNRHCMFCGTPEHDLF